MGDGRSTLLGMVDGHTLGTLGVGVLARVAGVVMGVLG